MNNDPLTNQQEIDLISFFRAIGNLFKSIGNIVKYFFVYLFNHLIYRPFVYFKKFKKILLPLLIIAFLLGLVLDMAKKELYISEILVTPAYDSGKEVYTNITYLNSLIDQQDTVQLAEILKISPEESASLIKFKIEPNYNERINAKHFNEYTMYLDSLALENLNYEKFINSFKDQKFDYPQHVIQVIASKPDVFQKLNPYFDNFLENIDIFKKRKTEFIRTSELLLEENMNSLRQLDSLRYAINQAIKNTGQVGDLPNGSVIVGSSQIKFPETQYDLFKKREKILESIRRIRISLLENNEILKMNSFFPEMGEPYNPFQRQFKFVFLLGLIILLIIIFNLIDVIHYLNRRYHREQNHINEVD